jgi:hypothetical protein
MPRKDFEAFSRLDASDVNTFLMNQSVMTFADTAARGSAIDTAVDGMTTYLEDTNTYEGYDGSAWRQVVSIGAWTSYTPTLAGITLGNGTMSARYALIGKTMHLRFDFTLGSTSAITGQARFSLPSGITTPFPLAEPVGVGNALIGSNFSLIVTVNTTSQLTARIQRADATYLVSENTTSTTPGTWTTGSKLSARATMEIN